jgi:hypothetical protein
MSQQLSKSWDQLEYKNVFGNGLPDYMVISLSGKVISELLKIRIPRTVPAPDWIRGAIVQTGSFERYKMAPELHEWFGTSCTAYFQMKPTYFLEKAVPEYVVLTIVEWFLKLLDGGASRADALSIMIENVDEIQYNQNPRCKNLDLSKVDGPFRYIDCFDRAMIPRIDPRREFELGTAVSIFLGIYGRDDSVIPGGYGTDWMFPVEQHLKKPN